MYNEMYDYKFNILLAGLKDAGRKEFVMSYFEKTEYEYDWLNTWIKETLIKDDKKIILRFLNDRDQDLYKCETQFKYYLQVTGSIIMYNVNDNKSLKRAQDWLKMVRTDFFFPKTMPIIIVANNHELADIKYVEKELKNEFESDSRTTIIETSLKDKDKAKQIVELFISKSIEWCQNDPLGKRCLFHEIKLRKTEKRKKKNKCYSGKGY